MMNLETLEKGMAIFKILTNKVFLIAVFGLIAIFFPVVAPFLAINSTIIINSCVTISATLSVLFAYLTESPASKDIRLNSGDTDVESE